VSLDSNLRTPCLKRTEMAVGEHLMSRGIHLKVFPLLNLMHLPSGRRSRRPQLSFPDKFLFAKMHLWDSNLRTPCRELMEVAVGGQLMSPDVHIKGFTLLNLMHLRSGRRTRRPQISCPRQKFFFSYIHAGMIQGLVKLGGGFISGHVSG
jgi:hypothetical protein